MKKLPTLVKIPAFASAAMLLISACDSSRDKNSNREPAPTTTETSQVNPIVAVEPAPPVIAEPIPDPVFPTPDPDPVEDDALPAARLLTAAEKEEYLAQGIPVLSSNWNYGRLGAGFDTENIYWFDGCMERSASAQPMVEHTYDQNQFFIMPLTSQRQIEVLFAVDNFHFNHELDNYDDDNTILTLVAAIRKVRKSTKAVDMSLNPALRNLSLAEFAERCGQVYEVGTVYGFQMFSAIWFESDANHSREDILSRLIDSKRIGRFDDAKAFSENLHDLWIRIQTSQLPVRGYGLYHHAEVRATSLSFDFSKDVESWLDQAAKVELDSVPRIGSVLESY